MRIAHLSDLHVGKTAAEWPAMIDLVQRTVALRPDAIVVSGDLIDDPRDHQLLHKVRLALEHSGLWVLAVPGNHDVETPGENEAWEREFDAFPQFQSVAGGNFLLFDSFGGLPIKERSVEDHECFANTGCWLDGRVSAAQFAAMEKRLARANGPRIAVVHHHLQPSPDEQVNPLQNANAFCEWCVENDVGHVFVGHLHRTVPAEDVYGVRRYRIGRSTKAPYPIGLLDLDSGTYEIHLRE